MQLTLRALSGPNESPDKPLPAGSLGLTVALAAGAVVALAAAQATWHAPVTIDPDGMALLLILAVCAVNFPLPATPRRRIDASVAVHFACLVLYGTPVAIAMVGLSSLAGRSILAVRARRRGASFAEGMEDAIASTAQLMVGAAAGGAVFFGLLPQHSPAPLLSTDALLALPASAAAMWGAGALCAGLRDGRWRCGLRAGLRLRSTPGLFVETAVVYLVGVIIAIATYGYSLAPIVMAVPIALVYSSLRRTIGGLLLDQAFSAVEAMADVVDMRDTYTFQHSQRVAHYATEIAREMGMRREDVRQIALAARVHDLGKLGVPDRVLLKAGQLSSSEREMMERHPLLGYEILSRFPEYVHGRHLVLSHHEQPDGGGYPRGLRGGEVPRGAYVIAVADALDAMTSDRPYRSARSLAQAMAVFAKGSGSQWHKDAVQALSRLVERLGPALLLDAPAWREASHREPESGSRRHATIRMPAAR
jgi:HD-GYP domain-containing protein (c-di-GMP phosphodiesterase class II)